MSFPPNHGVESSSSSYSPLSCRQFTLTEIELATRNFDESWLLGSGGFAKVYRGTITYEERTLDVAVKRLTPGSNEEATGFWYEVDLMSKLRHPNLVSQIGYCSDGQEMIFVYDYMPLGTLYHRLHKGGLPLSWVRRLKICLESARGLEYLHSETGNKSKVLHLDVKSSNILLTSNWEARVSDFGMSKVRQIDSAYETDNVGGTLGYLDPEYQGTGVATRKTDVFAFGVVMFELLCGKKAYPRIDGVYQFLRSWAQDSIKKGKLKQITDPNLEGRISSECLKKFAVLADRCLDKCPEQRPTMAEVVKDLECILALHDKAHYKLLSKLSSGRSSDPEKFGLKSLDIYLYAIVGENYIVPQFDFNTLVQATENFSEANKFWSDQYNKFIYKGRLQNGQAITITKYVKNYEYDECRNEVSSLVKLEHENVIKLLGYCINRTSLYLIYDSAAIATLDNLLFDPTCDALDWNKRYKIIMGVAKGLVYLHNRAPIQIIHYDVAPENILLDGNFEPSLSNFRFAKEIKETNRARDRSTTDVFRFGNLILYIVTGRKSIQGSMWLDDYLKTKKEEGTLLDIIDPRIKNVDSSLMIKFMEIVFLCRGIFDTNRLTMEEVVEMLLPLSTDD